MAEGLQFIFSRIVIVLIVITVVSVVSLLRQAKNIMAEGDVKSGSKRAPMIFAGAMLVYVLVAFTNARMIPAPQHADKVFPKFVGAVTIVALLLLFVQTMRCKETDSFFADMEVSGADAEAPHGLWPTLAGVLGLLVLTSLVGFLLALAVFLVAFFRIRAGRDVAAHADPLDRRQRLHVLHGPGPEP